MQSHESMHQNAEISGLREVKYMELRPLHQKESTTAKKIVPLLVGFFIIAVMVLSVLEFGNQGNEETIKYNGHKFTKINDRWVTYVNNNKIALLYNPKDVEDAKADADYGSLLMSAKTYFSFDQSQPALFLPANELMLNKNILGITSQLILACPSDNEACEAKNLPIKTCDDASVSTGIILFETANETSMSFKNNCLKFQGTQEGINKLLTRLVLKRLGIV